MDRRAFFGTIFGAVAGLSAGFATRYGDWRDYVAEFGPINQAKTLCGVRLTGWLKGQEIGAQCPGCGRPQIACTDEYFRTSLRA